MPTLQELLDEDLGLGGQHPGTEKTASAEQTAESDDIEKLAEQIGILPNKEETPTTPASEVNNNGQTKEASAMSLETLYSDLYPGDADVVGGSQEKVAADKTAAVKEEAMGAVAYDHFEQCFDNHITKIAEELTGDATVDAKVDESTDGKPVQTMKDNQPANSDDPIDTAPAVTDEVTAKPGDPKVTGVQNQTTPVCLNRMLVS